MGYTITTTTEPISLETRRFDPDPRRFVLPVAWIKLEQTTTFNDRKQPQRTSFRLYTVEDLHRNQSPIQFNPWEMIYVAQTEIARYRDGPHKDPKSIAQWHKDHIPQLPFYLKQIRALEEVTLAMQSFIDTLKDLKIAGEEGRQFQFTLTTKSTEKDVKEQYINVYKRVAASYDPPDEKHLWITEKPAPLSIQASS